MSQQPQPQQSWMSSMNGGPSGQMSSGLPQQMSNMGSQNQHQDSSVPSSQFHPSLVQSQQQPPVPRSGPTPQQMAHLIGRPPLGSPQPSPNMQPMPPSRPASHQPGIMPQQLAQRPPDTPGPSGLQNGLSFAPPIDANVFQRFLQQFIATNNIPVDQQILTILDRRVDLHQLHVEVIRRGGWKAVNFVPTISSYRVR